MHEVAIIQVRDTMFLNSCSSWIIDSELRSYIYQEPLDLLVCRLFILQHAKCFMQSLEASTLMWILTYGPFSRSIQNGKNLRDPITLIFSKTISSILFHQADLACITFRPIHYKRILRSQTPLISAVAPTTAEKCEQCLKPNKTLEDRIALLLPGRLG
jgi:hypothetical protein